MLFEALIEVLNLPLTGVNLLLKSLRGITLSKSSFTFADARLCNKALLSGIVTVYLYSVTLVRVMSQTY